MNVDHGMVLPSERFTVTVTVSVSVSVTIRLKDNDVRETRRLSCAA